MTVHTLESLATELSAALEFVQTKYGTQPTKMRMNRHTRDELTELLPCGPTNVLDVTWADIPVKLDETRLDHEIAFDMPDTVKSPTQLEESANEQSLPVQSV